MYRLPFRAMCCRETNRLPIAELHKMLGSKVPNIENGRAANEDPSDPKYFVYYGHPSEFVVPEENGGYECANFYTNHFMLVEVDGLKETILDKGRADSISIVGFLNGRQYAKIYGHGQKIGLFVYYCSSPEPE